MPTVPYQRQVGTAALPSVRVSPNAPTAAFGAPAEIDVSGVRQGVDQLYQDARARANAIAINAASVELEEAATAARAKAFDLRGLDAARSTDVARAEYERAVGSIRMRLSTDQQLVFDQRAALRWTDLHAATESHLSAESQRVDGESTRALVDGARNDALENFSDPALVAAAVQKQALLLDGYARRNGIPPEVARQQIAQQVSATHFGVIGRYLDGGQDIAARRYYEQNKAVIAGDDRGKIERALQESSTLGEATRRADAILAGENVTPTSALAAAEAIEDPRVRQEALQQITGHFSRLNTAQRLERENASARLIADMRANGGRLNRGSLDWQLLDGHPEGEHVLDVQREILHPVEKGDPDAYLSYVAMANTSPDTRRALMDTPIEDILQHATMSPGQKSSVLALRRGALASDLAELKRQSAAADADVKRYQKLVNDAVKIGDAAARETNQSYLFDAKQRAKVLQGQVQAATRQTRIAAPERDPSQAAAPSEPPATNPFGLTPAKPMTPDMAADIAKYGARYADYLRNMGYDVPAASSGSMKPDSTP